MLRGEKETNIRKQLEGDKINNTHPWYTTWSWYTDICSIKAVTNAADKDASATADSSLLESQASKRRIVDISEKNKIALGIVCITFSRSLNAIETTLYTTSNVTICHTCKLRRSIWKHSHDPNNLKYTTIVASWMITNSQ